jgi:hypothetical protein
VKSSAPPRCPCANLEFIADLIDVDLPQISFAVEVCTVFVDVNADVTIAALDGMDSEFVQVLLYRDLAIEAFECFVGLCRGDQGRVLCVLKGIAVLRVTEVYDRDHDSL